MRIFQADAFTRTPFAGNPATVILDAEGRSDATLAAIAREFAQAEVAYVLPAQDDSHDLSMRFFNARKEAPFVGHATVAAHAVLLALGTRPSGMCRQRSGTGIVEVSAVDGTVEFRQTLAALDPPLPLKTTLRVAEALKLPATHLHDAMPARIARKGSSRLLIPVADCAALDSLAPNMDTLIALGRELGTEGFFVFFAQGTGDAVSTDSRMFCPAIGINEDPVSGNAHAMLASYLWQLEYLDSRTPAFIGRQGRQVGRPGEVSVALDVDAGALQSVRISGAAVVVSEGVLKL